MSNGNNKGKHIIVTGMVQGVFYRAFAKKQARKLSILGWTRNLSDGSVEVIAYGIDSSLEKFIEKLKDGPKASRVDNLEINEVDYDPNYINFKIVSSK